jgi:hypothetical protein
MDPPRRPFERCEEPVAHGLDLAPPVALQLGAHDLVVSATHGAPIVVAELGAPLRGSDDVGEQDRGECSVATKRGARASHELLNLGSHQLRVIAEEESVRLTGELHEPRSFDAGGQVACRINVGHRVVRPIHDQGGYSDGREDSPDVNIAVHPFESRERARSDC